MAGNIPPLVSSTPPPLNAFDEDEEEEEDEFGLYNTAEEIDFNDCISFEEKDKENQNKCKSKSEQDSTSQNSATDSGLCPDSEGMSPTFQSDDERTVKHNSCDELCRNSGELNSQGIITSVNLSADPSPNLVNGHINDNSEQESGDDFGNFEFAPSSKVGLHTEVENTIDEDILERPPPSDAEQCIPEEHCGDFGNFEFAPSSKVGLHTEVENTIDEGILERPPPSDAEQCIPEEHCGDVSNIHLHNEQSTKEVSSELRSLESNINGIEFGDETGSTSGVNCKYVHSNLLSNELSVEKLDDVSCNDTSSTLESNLKPNARISTEHVLSNSSPEIEPPEYDNNHCLTNPPDEDNFTTMTPCDEKYHHSERTKNENPTENDEDDEFDDFTDFKAGGFEINNLSQVRGEQFSENSDSVIVEATLEDDGLPSQFVNQEVKDDEFSEFADFSSSDCVFVSARSSDNSENIPKSPTKLISDGLRTEIEFQDWVSVFPCEDETSLVVDGLLRQDDVVWSRLFPLEASPAICYQWNESLANRRLLTALNIDSRNILLTPWSLTAVPRFAANLSCGPLEPIKASEPQIAPSFTPSTATTVATSTAPAAVTPAVPTSGSAVPLESVPDAHFDWVGSGLTNPLDCQKTAISQKKTLSAEAEKLLATLPDISFMRKTYIDFPITSNI